jgi:hypothetical protein
VFRNITAHDFVLSGLIPAFSIPAGRRGGDPWLHRHGASPRGLNARDFSGSGGARLKRSTPVRRAKQSPLGRDKDTAEHNAKTTPGRIYLKKHNPEEKLRINYTIDSSEAY